MKNKVHLMACSATIAAAMMFQVLCPSVALAAKMTDNTTETDVTVESTVTGDEDDGSVVDETLPVDTSSETEYSEETTEVIVSDETEPESDETNSSATDTDPTDETDVTDETDETLETEETEEESTVEIIEASDMDEFIEIVSGISSSYRVIVSTTTDISEDIENAVGVYFDGVYIVSFEDEESYNDAISFFTNSGISYCQDGMVEVNGISDSFRLVNNAEINANGSVRVAIIDTGSNLANESYSVIGDYTGDDNGHGTRMAQLVLDNDADNAYIVSIKALGADGHGSIVDVYNAVQLAIDLDVDYILMSFSTINSTEYSAFKELLSSASAYGVTVVASAGNNGMNASFYVPACVSGVTTIGAMNEDYTKQSSSNYGSCVNYYVVADSTSDAAAMYVGYSLAGNTTSIFTTYLEEAQSLDDSELFALYSSIANDITNQLIAEYGYGECRLQVNENGEYELVYVFEGAASSDVVINARPDSDLVSYGTNVIADSPVALTDGMSGTDRGTASFTRSSAYPGFGTISGISSTGTTGSGLTLAQFTSSMNVACSRGYGEEASRYATPIPDGAVDYEATYSVSGGIITWTVKIGKTGTNISQPTWEQRSLSTTWRIVAQGGSTGVEYVAYVNGQGAGTASATEAGAITTITNAVNAAVADIASSIANDEFGAKKNLSTTGLPRGVGSGTAVSTWYVTVDTQVFEGTLTNTNVPQPQHGAVDFNKVDGNNAALSGATIYFVCTAGEGLGHENDLTLQSPSSVASYSSVTYNGRLGLQFVTNGNTVTIEMLAPNSTYVFHEAVPPTNPTTGMPYDLADDIFITTDANGNATPATITMIDETTIYDGNYGSFSLTKTWTGADETANYFWSSVDEIGFGIYGIGFTADNIRQYVTQTSNPLGGVSQLAGGTLSEPSSGNSHTVYWTWFNSDAIFSNGQEIPYRGANPEWYHFAEVNPITHDLHNWLVLGRDQSFTGVIVGIQRERYFVVTESWTSYKMDGTVEDYYIDTLNNSGWHEIGSGNGSHRYAAVYYVGRNGVTYMCDWDTLQPIYALSLHQSPSGRYYDDEYYFDIVDNEEATGSLDVVKIDQTGLGVDGVRFELRSGDNPDNLLGTGTIGNSIGQVGGYDAYNVLWDYTLIRPGYIRWQYMWGTNSGPGDNDDAVHLERQTLGPAYNIRDLVPGGDMNRVLVTASTLSGSQEYWTANQFLAMYQDYLQWRADGEPHVYNGATPINSQYLYNHSNDLWYGTAAVRSPLVPAPKVFPVNFGLGANFNPVTGNLNEISETDAEFVSHLNYGDYYIYEYIEDSNGNNIIGSNGYETPDGWTAYDGNNDGVPEYFYIRVTVTEDHLIVPLTVNCANSILGKIDVTKVNLTGGPLTDLSFDIRNSNGDVIATGYIPADAEPQTTGTGTATDYTYSATWDYTRNGRTITGKPIVAGTGLGTFTIREYIPVSAVENRTDLDVSSDWAYGGVTTHNGVACYFFTKTIVIDDTNASELQVATITNAVSPEIGTTLTDFADRHITVVGENITFTDVVAYSGAYVGGSYTMYATLVDVNGNPLSDRSGNVYHSSTTFTTTSGHGTVNVSFTVNTADLVEAVQNADGTLTYSPRSVVCFESMRLVGTGTASIGPEVGRHEDTTDTNQTVEIPNPEIGTQFADLQTEEHETVSGRIVEVVDHVSFTNLHIGETYTLTCRLYDQTTGNALQYSNGDLVIGTKTFVPTTESGTVDVTFTIDTSDLLVNIFQYEERTLVAFEYLRTENGILIGGHTDINDLPQHITPRLPSPRTSFTDDSTGSHNGRLGAMVPFTDRVSYTNLNIGESYQMRSSVVNRENPSIVYATAVVDFVPTSRDGYVDVHFIVDTSEVCAGSYDADIVCFEQLWQLDTQNTGRGDVLLARHEDVRDQDQTIHLHPEIQTQMRDVETNSNYGMIGDNVEFIDTVSFHNLHVGETYTVSGIIMDKQTGLPVLDRNGQPFEASTTFVAQTTDGTVDVTYHVDTLYLISQIGQTVNGVVVEAPRDLVSFETITSSTGFDFEIHADINDEGQTITVGDITSSAGDIQTSTRVCAAGLTTIRDTVHYRGLGPVQYTLRGSLHYVDYDNYGNPVDGGPVIAQSGETVSTEYTWTPSTHEGDVVLDYRIDTSRMQGRDIIVFEELWYGGVCIITHENYHDSNGGYGMRNYEQTVHVPSVHTNATSFQTGAQLVAYDTQATINDFVYYGNVEIGRAYYVEGILWGCYTDEAGQIHSVNLSEQGGRVCSDTFTATQKSGVVEVRFTVDSTTFANSGYDYLVVTERLVDVGSGVCVGYHGSLTDQDQTIYVPELHTTAFTDTGKTLPEGNMPDIQRVTVTDRVYYENLVCDGRTYTVVGNVQYAKTDANGNITESGALVQNGQAVTNTVTFVPTSPNGYIDVEFSVDVSDIMAHEYNKIVVFEDLYYGPEGVVVAHHADITDEEQTVNVPDMHTTALGANGRHNVQATASTVINDTITYSGLTPLREYRIETDLMSSKTHESIAHVTTLFIPTESSGTITVSMTADLTGYTAGDYVVVFEDCYDNSTGILIKSHHDWNDTDQTVETGGGGDTGVLDINANKYLYCAIGCVLALVGLVASEGIKRRRILGEQGSSDSNTET